MPPPLTHTTTTPGGVCPPTRQAQCGSCWAFAATGAMEGAWFVATSAGRSFSEQQLIDCAWDEVRRRGGGGWGDAHRSLPAIRPPARLQGPTGCDGGDAQPAFSYISKAGGIAQTQVCTCSTWSAQQSPTCTTKACIAYVQ